MPRQSFGRSAVFAWSFIRPYPGKTIGPFVDASGVLSSFCRIFGGLGSDGFGGGRGIDRDLSTELPPPGGTYPRDYKFGRIDNNRLG